MSVPPPPQFIATLSAPPPQFADKAPAPPPAADPIAPPQPPANIEPVPAIDTGDVAAVWQSLLADVRDQGGLYGLLSQGRLINIGDESAVVEFGNEFGPAMMEKTGRTKVIRDKLSRLIGRPIGVKFEVVDVPPPEPIAEAPARPADTAPRPAPAPAAPPHVPEALTAEQKAAAEADPIVRATLDLLGGTIVRIDAAT